MVFPQLDRLITLRATEVWGHEAQGFTPWLAQNLDLLADALKIDELELKGTEVSAGDFRLDILAEDAQGHPVLIENQFGPTDHKHLGQLISYVASQVGPATVVWVAERFKEDHRAAIDWLNASTVNDFDFFAVEIEALKIGESAPAPFFNLVAKPNSWARSVSAVTRSSTTDELAERHKIRLNYWASFADYLQRHDTRFSIRRPNKDHWFEFPIGRSGVVISATINTKPKRIGVELYFHRDPFKAGIRQLEAERPVIETAFGEALEWQELPGKKASRVALYRHDLDPINSEHYPEIHRWMLTNMNRFKQVFADRVRSLKLDAPLEGDEIEDVVLS
jgi:hypothetical protein